MKEITNHEKEKTAWTVSLFVLMILVSPTLFIAVQTGMIVYRSAARQYEDSPSEIARYTVNMMRGKRTPLKSRPLLNDKRTLMEGRGGWNYLFADLYGGFQRLLGKRSVAGGDNGRFLLLNDAVINRIPQVDEKSIGESLEAVTLFQEKLAEKKIPFLFFPPLFKVCSLDPLLPSGAEDAALENWDIFLNGLDKRNIARLDLHDALHREGKDHHALFFRTDHHWLPEAGLWAAKTLSAYLNEHHGFSYDPSLFEESAYNTTLYKGIFRGTFFSSYGPWYLKPDDFSLILPKFPTSFSVETTTKAKKFSKTGDFQETLLDMSRLDTPDSSLYLLYIGDNYGCQRIVNLAAPNEKKIVFIHDSYACAIIPFLALSCQEIVSIDLRGMFRTVSNLQETIDEIKPDIVIVESGTINWLADLNKY